MGGGQGRKKKKEGGGWVGWGGGGGGGGGEGGGGLKRSRMPKGPCFARLMASENRMVGLTGVSLRPLLNFAAHMSCLRNTD